MPETGTRNDATGDSGAFRLEPRTPHPPRACREFMAKAWTRWVTRLRSSWDDDTRAKDEEDDDLEPIPVSSYANGNNSSFSKGTSYVGGKLFNDTFGRDEASGVSANGGGYGTYTTGNGGNLYEAPYGSDAASASGMPSNEGYASGDSFAFDIPPPSMPSNASHSAGASGTFSFDGMGASLPDVQASFGPSGGQAFGGGGGGRTAPRGSSRGASKFSFPGPPGQGHIGGAPPSFFGSTAAPKSSPGTPQFHFGSSAAPKGSGTPQVHYGSSSNGQFVFGRTEGTKPQGGGNDSSFGN